MKINTYCTCILQLLISQGDFTAMMNVLNENLSEGQDKTKKEEKPEETEAVATSVEETVTAETAGTYLATIYFCNLILKHLLYDE